MFQQFLHPDCWFDTARLIRGGIWSAQHRASRGMTISRRHADRAVGASIRSRLAVFVCLVLLATTGLAAAASAGTLGGEPPDLTNNYPTANTTYTAAVGTNTVTGSLGPTPTDGQDPFNVNISSTLEVTSVTYSGPAGPHNLVGCGLTGTSVLNQTFSPAQSGCQLSWYISTNYAESASAWTVTINTQLKPVSCLPGTFSPSGQAPCQNAPAGSFVSTSGAASATPCQVGTYQPNSGAASCLLASVNTFVDTQGAIAATPCPSGTSQPLEGQTSCIASDTQDPTWSVPGDITVGTDPGVSTAGVTYTATPSDNVAVASSSCTPNSAATFPLGTTTVNCTATDAAGNTGNASFTVTVEVDGSSIGTLDDEIAALGLPNGVTRSLRGPMNQAERLLNNGNPRNDGAVCNKLDSFLNHVQDQLADGNLTAAQAASLTAFGEAIKASLGCQ